MTGYIHHRFLLLLILANVFLLGACSSSRKVAAGNNTGPAALSEKALRQKYAAKVAAAPQDIDNIPLYRFIDEWYGTPYRWGGNGRQGIDCSGFSLKLYTTIYRTSIPRTAQLQYDAAKKIRKRKLREGDLVFFKEKGRKITHVGVYLTNRYFVHASTGNGVIISNLDDDYWDAHFVKGGKLR